MINYLLLTSAWFLYFLLHSVLAADSVKSFFEGNLKSVFRYYRIVYSLISTIGLFLLILFNASVVPVLLFKSEGWVRYLSLMLATLGVLVISQAFREYRFSTFIGLRREANEFARSGILNQVRHPIYSGTILIVLGFLLFNPTLSTLISVACILVYLPVGIHLEEKKLIKQFGDEYISYKKLVPSIFPKIKI